MIFDDHKVLEQIINGDMIQRYRHAGNNRVNTWRTQAQHHDSVIRSNGVFLDIGEVEIKSDEYPTLRANLVKHQRIGRPFYAFILTCMYIVPSRAQGRGQFIRQVFIQLE